MLLNNINYYFNTQAIIQEFKEAQQFPEQKLSEEFGVKYDIINSIKNNIKLVAVAGSLNYLYQYSAVNPYLAWSMMATFVLAGLANSNVSISDGFKAISTIFNGLISKNQIPHADEVKAEQVNYYVPV